MKTGILYSPTSIDEVRKKWVGGVWKGREVDE